MIFSVRFVFMKYSTFFDTIQFFFNSTYSKKNTLKIVQNKLLNLISYSQIWELFFFAVDTISKLLFTSNHINTEFLPLINYDKS